MLLALCFKVLDDLSPEMHQFQIDVNGFEVRKRQGDDI
jgi:hypothetical protein